LSLAQRQKLGLARAIMKRPDMLILYDPLGPLDLKEQTELREALLETLTDSTVIWALQHEEWASAFDQVLELREGRLVRHGPASQDTGPETEAPQFMNAK
jgi:ABC-type sulfate/molybdate transport systems ATPase subunit